MKAGLSHFGAVILLLAGCATEPSPRSVEVFDERSGMTAGALPAPIAFMETGMVEDLANPSPKQAGMAYLGPVEWDRSGEIRYMLWMQIAPGVDGHRLDDIRAPGAVNLRLDDGLVRLSMADLSNVTNPPYQSKDPVGQAAYFTVDAALLKRIAQSQKIVLNIRGADLAGVDFTPTHETRDALQQFMRDRGVGGG